jgi:hypothetical protein
MSNMDSHFSDRSHNDHILVTSEVLEYINQRKCDFRICTSCGGPILLPVSMKSPKPNDFQVKAGDYTIFISIHQARYLHAIDMGMVPFFFDQDEYPRGL